MKNGCFRFNNSKASWWLASLFLICFFGCGSSSTVPVSGQVTFDGKPIENGEIVFTPVEGTAGPTTGGSITNGKYEVPGEKGLLIGGKYRVEINGFANTGRKIEAAPGYFVDAADNFIPASYNSESTLQVTISADSPDSRNDFALSSNKANK